MKIYIYIFIFALGVCMSLMSSNVNTFLLINLMNKRKNSTQNSTQKTIKYFEKKLKKINLNKCSLILC